MSAKRSRRFLLRVILPVLLLQVTACASATRVPKKELYWPEAPPRATIQWMEEIRNRHDAGIGKGMWEAVADFITGREDGGIGKPYGLFVDHKGRIFIVDAAQRMIHTLDPGAKRSGMITGDGKAGFRTPIGITGDGETNLYITDAGAGSVYAYDLKDQSLRELYKPTGGRPTGIAFNPATRHLYVADTLKHEIVVMDQTGRVRSRFGSRGEGPGQFNFPTDLFVDAEGRLYVTDALNARIQVFTASGAFLKTFGAPGDSPGEFAKPKGVAVDSAGNIYVCDALQDMVKVFDTSGNLLLEFGANGTKEGEFWMPAGLHIDRNDTIYVADTYNRRVQLFRYLKARPADERAGARMNGGSKP